MCWLGWVPFEKGVAGSTGMVSSDLFLSLSVRTDTRSEFGCVLPHLVSVDSRSVRRQRPISPQYLSNVSLLERHLLGSL